VFYLTGARHGRIHLSFGEIYAMSAAFVADVFDHHAGWADKLAGETLPPYQGGDHLVFTLREPVGVVGAVIPWNAPLALFAQKVAPALAAGCTIVLKPSEYATFAVLRLARLIAEAVRLANDTEYGLAATAWTSDVSRAMRMTRALRAGTVGVNGFQLEPNWPFGGFRQSGLGREGGRAAVESYTELKTVLLPFTDEMM
jgi:acyl-CoA reductase-like NAD-dependent aldehyde dehydrogenase